jgi:hypothetical protein
VLTLPGKHEKSFGRAAIVKKRKRKRFEAGKEARRRARASGVVPATTRVIPDKRKREAKHKKDWLEKELE